MIELCWLCVFRLLPPPTHLDGLALGGSIVGHAARVLLHRAVRVRARVRVRVIGLSGYRVG